MSDMDPDQLSRIEAKLDRLLDPEEGVYARMREHESADALVHQEYETKLTAHETKTRTWFAIAASSAALAGGSHPKVWELLKTLIGI